MWLIVYLLLLANAAMAEVVLPVHSANQTCQESYFPWVSSQGILACNRAGQVDRFWDFEHQVIVKLPHKSNWALGEGFYHLGLEGGFWEALGGSWFGPRVFNDDAAARVYGSEVFVLQENEVLWINQQQKYSAIANPVQGQFPVKWKEEMVWIEYSPSQICFWDRKNINCLEAELPTNLCAADLLYWLEADQLISWDGEHKSSQRVEGIHSFSCENNHLCWSAWGGADLDIFCVDYHLQRKGHQMFPKQNQFGLFFTEQGQIFQIVFNE